MNGNSIIQRMLSEGKTVYRPTCTRCWEEKEPLAYAIIDGRLVCGDPHANKDGTITLWHDMLCYHEEVPRYEDLGLIDAHAWYERDKVYQEMMCKAVLEGTGNAALQRELDARHRRIKELEKQVCELKKSMELKDINIACMSKKLTAIEGVMRK